MLLEEPFRYDESGFEKVRDYSTTALFSCSDDATSIIDARTGALLQRCDGIRFVVFIRHSIALMRIVQ